MTDFDASVLIVCTGNICRSPAAERLLAVALGPDVRIESAGTYAMRGRPISPPMDSLIASAGASADGFAGRQVNESLARSATLVLALTRAHRAQLVELAPAVVRRAFTLKEFASLLSAVDPSDLPAEGGVAERLKASIPLAAARRGQTRRAAKDDDVADPYTLGDDAYRAAFDEIDAAVRTIGRVING